MPSMHCGGRVGGGRYGFCRRHRAIRRENVSPARQLETAEAFREMTFAGVWYNVYKRCPTNSHNPTIGSLCTLRSFRRPTRS